MGPKTKALIDILDETITILKKCDEKIWAEYLEESKRSLESSKITGLTSLLSAFGGMGSFNDLYICEINGHNIKRSEEESVNMILTSLRGKIYSLATDIEKVAEFE